MENIRGRNYKAYFLVVLIVVLLSSCILVGSLVAWLKVSKAFSSNENLRLGSVDFEIYAGDTRITATKHSYENDLLIVQSASPLSITGVSAIREGIDLEVRNIGTVSALVRVTLQIYYIDSFGNPTTLIEVTGEDAPINQNELKLETGSTKWVNDMKGGVLSGYAYYNEPVKPYNIRSVKHNADGTELVTTDIVEEHAVSVLSQMLLPDSMKAQTYYVSIIVEGVAHSGNIYREIADKKADKDYQIDKEAYPFGLPETLPSDWIAWE